MGLICAVCTRRNYDDMGDCRTEYLKMVAVHFTLQLINL